MDCLTSDQLEQALREKRVAYLAQIGDLRRMKKRLTWREHGRRYYEAHKDACLAKMRARYKKTAAEVHHCELCNKDVSKASRRLHEQSKKHIAKMTAESVLSDLEEVTSGGTSDED